jgi:hypothetical protein
MTNDLFDRKETNREAPTLLPNLIIPVEDKKTPRRPKESQGRRGM